MAETSEESSQLVFVYGNLAKGFWHDLILAERPLLGKARTEEPYAMYQDVSVHVTKRLALTPIVGDLYEVDSRTLHDLDLFNGHPEWYHRERVTVIGQDGRTHIAWMYFRDDTDGELIS